MGIASLDPSYLAGKSAVSVQGMERCVAAAALTVEKYARNSATTTVDRSINGFPQTSPIDYAMPYFPPHEQELERGLHASDHAMQR
jgi:hypothetical protein